MKDNFIDCLIQVLFILTWFFIGAWCFWHKNYKDAGIALSLSYCGASYRHLPEDGDWQHWLHK